MPAITQLAPGVLDRRFAEVGRIRLGDGTWSTKINKDGKEYRAVTPRKLTKPRLTSTRTDLLARAAEVYGGTVRPWADAPTGPGTQHELFIEADVLDVLVPPGQILTQAYELWSGGGCARRCNGLATETGEPCVCPEDPDERSALAQNGKACRLTTRLTVWLPRLPGMGGWRVESHGYYTGLELPGVAELLSAASAMGRPVAATLSIASRKGIRDGQTRQYIVPVLDPAEPIEIVMAIAAGRDVSELSRPTPVAALEPPKPAALEVSTGPQKVGTRWVSSVAKKLEEGGMVEPAEIEALVGHATAVRSGLADVAQADADKVKEAVAAFAAGRLVVQYGDDGTVTFSVPVVEVVGGEPY